jgi:hypothetical protein
LLMKQVMALFLGQAKWNPIFYFMHSNLEWNSVHSNFLGVGSCPLQYTMDIENTVQVLTCTCPGNLGVTTPYHPNMRKLTPRQYSQHPYKYLEWKPFHSKFFCFLGVKNHALKVHSKNLECTSIPLHKCLSAPQVHPKFFGLHFKSTPKKLDCAQKLDYTTFHFKNVKMLKCTTAQSNFFGVDGCSLHFFWSENLPTPKCWSACSKRLECI